MRRYVAWSSGEREWKESVGQPTEQMRSCLQKMLQRENSKQRAKAEYDGAGEIMRDQGQMGGRRA
eukprot:1070085-Pleurochrysis_carterae.AAC.1